MSFHEAIQRLADTLEDAPPPSDGRTLVPLAALLDVVEHSAGVLRAAGRDWEADRLDAVRRAYLMRRPESVIQSTRNVGSIDKSADIPRQPRRRPVPGRR